MRTHFFGLRHKIVLLYFLLGIIPVILVGSLSYLVYSNDIQRNANITLDYVQEQCTGDIHLQFKEYKNTLTSIVTNPEILRFAQMLDKLPEDETENSRQWLGEALTEYARSAAGIQSIAYIASSAQYAAGSVYLNGAEAAKWQEPSFREKFLSLPNKDFSTDHYRLLLSRDIAPNAPLADTLYLTFPVMDRLTKETFGVLSMEIQLNVLLDEMTADVWGGVDNIITDRSGEVILSAKPELLGRNIMDLPYGDDTRYFSRSVNVQNSELVLRSFASRAAITNRTRKFRSWMVLMIALICAVFFTAMYLIMSRYTKSVQDIVDGIRSYGEGNHNIRLQVGASDEMALIADQFNHMIGENNALLQEMQDQNRHIARITNLRRKSEIKALQAQINPHFLYNTLETINWIAIDNRQDEISRIIKVLSSLLRYSVNGIDQLVLLEAELQWCEKYVYLQQKRFGTDFHFQVTADDEARMFPIHKMLLQPLLENCIVHGFDTMRNSGGKRIWMECSPLPDGRLSILLRDNGAGIHPEILRGIRELADSWKTPATGSIGIANVIERMRLYYGDQGLVAIESDLGQGTSVCLTIPPVREGR